MSPQLELRLGIPGSESPDMMSLTLALPKSSASGAKRGFLETINGLPGKADGESPGQASTIKDSGVIGKAAGAEQSGTAPAAKAQVVGWPPVRSYRKNMMAVSSSKNGEAEGKQGEGSMYVKVSMDGAPYLRKVDLYTYSNYKELSLALEKMFSCFTSGHCGSHGLPGRDGLSKTRLIDLVHGSECVLAYEDKDGDWMLVGDVPWDMFTSTCRRMRIMNGSDAIGIAPRAMEKSKNRS